MADNGYGYDPVTGLNSGNLDFQSLQGTVAGKTYYAPVPYNPAQNGGLNQNGFIDFGSAYNPTTNPYDYLYYGSYDDALVSGDHGLKPIVYGSAPTNSLAATFASGDPTINGVDYTQGAAYAALASKGVGTYAPNSYGVNDSSKTFGGSAAGVTPYTQYTEPGYTAPTETAATPTGTKSYNTQGQEINGQNPSEGTFYYGDNGSAGSISGVFSDTTPGQASQFYQNEPGSLTGAQPQSNLGYLAGQENNATTVTPAPTNTPFLRGGLHPVSDLSFNGALGGASGYNPLALSTPVTTQSNPALQALQAGRSLQ